MLEKGAVGKESSTVLTQLGFSVHTVNNTVLELQRSKTLSLNFLGTEVFSLRCGFFVVVLFSCRLNGNNLFSAYLLGSGLGLTPIGGKGSLGVKCSEFVKGN